MPKIYKTKIQDKDCICKNCLQLNLLFSLCKGKYEIIRFESFMC